VLEGSVRKSGQRVRITAQLIDANNRQHLWAERYDLELTEIFAVQDEITSRVAGAIEPELLKSEGERAFHRSGNISAWDLVRQGTWQFHHITRPTHMRARELFRKAIEMDPHLPEAHMWLGRVNESIVGYGWSEDPAADLREALQACLRGVQLDERDPYGHYALAMTNLFSGALERAVHTAEKAAELSPNFTLAHLGLGMTRLYVGRALEAIEPLERGLRMNPFDPQNFHWLRLLALAYYFTGQKERALQAAVRALQVRPTWPPALETLAICYAALDRLDEARQCVEQMALLDKPDSDLLAQLKARNPHWNEGMAVMLRKAAGPK